MAVAFQPAPAPSHPISDIPPTVARLRETFESGRTRPLEWRRAQLEGLLRFAREQGEALVAALQADMGKPELEARTADVGQIVVGRTVGSGDREIRRDINRLILQSHYLKRLRINPTPAPVSGNNGPFIVVVDRAAGSLTSNLVAQTNGFATAAA